MNEKALSRGEALAVLQEHRAALAEQFGVTDIKLFGSVARNQATANSDVDILVSFDGPANLDRIFDAQLYLEDLFGRPVDLVTYKELRPEVRPNVEADVAMAMNDSNETPPPMPRLWRFYVEDMIGFCQKVLEFTDGLDQEDFILDTRTNFATLHSIVLIGEAATHIPDEIRKAHPGIPFGRIIGARNRIIHGYLSVDDDEVWRIIRESVPALLPQLRELLEAE